MLGMVFGTFDLFHKGHQFYLKQAQFLCDEMVVIIARDKNVKNIKKSLPVWNEQKRLLEVNKFLGEGGTQIYLGDEQDFFLPIQKYNPQIIILGYDQVCSSELQQKITDLSIAIKRVRKSLNPQIYKSSKLKLKRITLGFRL